MDITSEWTATEQRLAREADSLAELLDGLRGRISPDLIGDREWQRLLERARELPASIAAYPFGFELPLHERRAGADLGVSVFGGTGPGAFFEQGTGPDGTASYAAGIARLLRATAPEDAPLRRILSRKMMLEFDVDAAPQGRRPKPGIFLRPSGQPIPGGQGRRGIEDIGIVIDALVSALGWKPDPAEVRQAERIYLAMEKNTRFESLGAFPSRERKLRIAVTGFRTASSLVAYLERAGWSGSHALVAATLARLEGRGAFKSLAANFDVVADDLGPMLGLSILARDRDPNDPGYWVDGPHQWTPLIETLRNEGPVVEEKLAALAGWSRKPATLFGKTGPFLLMQGIHHVKLVLARDRFDQAKAYVFMLLSGSMPSGQTSASSSRR